MSTQGTALLAAINAYGSPTLFSVLPPNQTIQLALKDWVTLMDAGGGGSGLPVGGNDGDVLMKSAGSPAWIPVVTATFLENTGASSNLTTNVAVNLASLSLPPGDWDVEGQVEFTLSATTVVTNTTVGVNTTSATLPNAPRRTFGNPPASGVLSATTAAGVTRVSVGTTTTVYLVGRATFTNNTLSAQGYLRARRLS